MDGGDGCTAIWMYLMPLNCIPKNDLNGKFYVMYILPQFFLKREKKTNPNAIVKEENITSTGEKKNGIFFLKEQLKK